MRFATPNIAIQRHNLTSTKEIFLSILTATRLRPADSVDFSALSTLIFAH
jgi:hypothetical protein